VADIVSAPSAPHNEQETERFPMNDPGFWILNNESLHVQGIEHRIASGTRDLAYPRVK
jgi:hypothetical protein